MNGTKTNLIHASNIVVKIVFKKLESAIMIKFLPISILRVSENSTNYHYLRLSFCIGTCDSYKIIRDYNIYLH